MLQVDVLYVRNMVPGGNRYECVRCDVGLCAAPCFERYYKVKVF